MRLKNFAIFLFLVLTLTFLNAAPVFDDIPPHYPSCIEDSENGVALNGVCNARDELVCFNDPILFAHIFDDKSNIISAEYFYDQDKPSDFSGYDMDAFDGAYDETAEDVFSIINLDNLNEGFHYVFLHGQDYYGNWGEIDSSIRASFIKDSIPPMSGLFFNSSKSKCNIESIGGQYLTDECYYVRNNSWINIKARDFNPDNNSDELGFGEGYNNLEGYYDGKIVLNYIVYFSLDGINWETLYYTSGGDSVDVLLGDEGYYLLEYWANDNRCGNEEEHHFELNIVDTASPISSKEFIGKNVSCPSNDSNYYNISKCLYVEGRGSVLFNCSDEGNYSVGGEVLNYSVESKESWDDNWSLIEEGSVGVNGEDSFVFNYDEDLFYKWNWFCADEIGNINGPYTSLDIVDSTPPKSWRNISGYLSYEGNSSEEYAFENNLTALFEWNISDSVYSLDENSLISLSCDDGNYSAGKENIYYKYFSEGILVKNWSLYDGYFNYNTSGYYELFYYCEDALGNKGYTHFALDIVSINPSSDTSSSGGGGGSKHGGGWGRGNPEHNGNNGNFTSNESINNSKDKDHEKNSSKDNEHKNNNPIFNNEKNRRTFFGITGAVIGNINTPIGIAITGTIIILILFGLVKLRIMFKNR